MASNTDRGGPGRFSLAPAETRKARGATPADATLDISPARIADIKFWNGVFRAGVSWVLFENGSAVTVGARGADDDLANGAIAALTEVEDQHARATARGSDWIVGPYRGTDANASVYVRVSASSAAAAAAAAQKILAEDRSTLSIVHLAAK